MVQAIDVKFSQNLTHQKSLKIGKFLRKLFEKSKGGRFLGHSFRGNTSFEPFRAKSGPTRAREKWQEDGKRENVKNGNRKEKKMQSSLPKMQIKNTTNGKTAV